ncbi:MAG: hypothetical protein E7445_07670 [Ruminococcaceae bacterium]|nr:hypothetical protein [Oscillospiraceae bacterium]
MGFLFAALPWVMFGLALSIYFSKVGAKKAGDGKGDVGRLNFGFCVGLISGALVSFLGLVPLGMGLGLGALLGVLLGSAGG